ncbi:WW domain protein [Necator americanus]|uniref:WW domain protein n=1 Tax=Necator americanus TaxID=51031 RepID=W2T9V8_NECAM|nr:WW domain protein [Necator americanus]ETN77996.1 WW domain protein [Necator americanus]
MGRERRKKLIEIPGLPEPWLAYMHLVKKKVFYYNPDANKSVWDLPSDVKKKFEVDLDAVEKEILKKLFTEDNDSLEMMDCTEWEEPAGSPKDPGEAMEIDFTEDLRQVRGSDYDKETLPLHSQSHQPFTTIYGTSRSCVVFDTCALIDDPNLIRDCISSEVLDRLFPSLPVSVRYLGGNSLPCLLRIGQNEKTYLNVRISGRITADSNSNNSHLTGRPWVSVDILGELRRVDARSDGWETVFLTNDQLLSLKAHASRIPCYNVKETKAILARAPIPVIEKVEEQAEFHPTVQDKPSTSTSKSPLRIGGKKPEKVLKRKIQREINYDPLRSPLCISKTDKKKNIEKLRRPHSDQEPNTGTKDPLKRFEEMWKPLVKVLEKKVEGSSVKHKRDVSRLRESASKFIESQDDKNLLLLVQMTWWLYYYYYPLERNEKQKDNYKDIMKDGLLKELTNPSARSQKMMNKLRKFSKDFESVYG